MVQHGGQINNSYSVISVIVNHLCSPYGRKMQNTAVIEAKSLTLWIPLNLLQHMMRQNALYFVDVHGLVELLFDAGKRLARNPNL
jgi:hypothetical protein